MSKVTREPKTNKERSPLSKQLIYQYFLSIVVYTGLIILIPILGKLFLHQFIWKADYPLYSILNSIDDNLQILVIVLIFMGYIVISYHFVSKSLRFVDEILSASKELASPTIEPIQLSKEMESTQYELNLVREKALTDAKAAKDAEQRKNDLVVYLAHDLKTPLTSVIGYLNLLCDEDDISETIRKKYLSITLNKALRLEDLINEFFEITRFNLLNISLTYSNVNITRLLEQLTFEAMPMFAEKNLVCKLDALPNLMVTCDVNKIQRVFDNLLRNAICYSFENTTIEVSVIQNNGKTTISFINEGNTISSEKLERIFEQFYRLDSSRGTHSGGSGLGLAIAKQIIELHGGRIFAKSDNNIIEFTLTLPSL